MAEEPSTIVMGGFEKDVRTLQSLVISQQEVHNAPGEKTMSPMGPIARKELLTRRWKARLTAVLFLLAFVGALGTSTAIAVEVSPQCHQVVKTYTTRLVKNVVKPETLRRWHLWAVGHPGWKPNPKHKRAPYKRVPQEISSLLDIACPANVPDLPAEDIALLSPDVPQYDLPAVDQPLFNDESRVPPVLLANNGPYGGFAPVFGGVGGGGGTTGTTTGTGGTPGGGTGTGGTTVPPPVIPPVLPTPAPVPEPDSLILALSGFAMAGAKTLYSRRRL